MRLRLLLAAGLLIPLALHADTVYLKNGFAYSNVKVDTLKSYNLINLDGAADTLWRNQILFVDVQDVGGDPIKVIIPDAQKDYFNKNYSAGFILGLSSKQPSAMADQHPGMINNSIEKDAYPNTIWLGAAAIAGAISMKYFIDATDYSKEIQYRENLLRIYGWKIDTHELKASRNGCYIFGVASALAAVSFTIYACLPVNINTGSDRVTLSYNF